MITPASRWKIVFGGSAGRFMYQNLVLQAHGLRLRAGRRGVRGQGGVLQLLVEILELGVAFLQAPRAVAVHDMQVVRCVLGRREERYMQRLQQRHGTLAGAAAAHSQHPVGPRTAPRRPPAPSWEAGLGVLHLSGKVPAAPRLFDTRLGNVDSKCREPHLPEQLPPTALAHNARGPSPGVARCPPGDGPV